MKTIPLLLCCIAISLYGCASILPSEKDKELLPDNGETSMQLMTGKPTPNAYYGNGQKAPYVGETIAPFYRGSSRYTNTHIDELHRDFQRVPNPEIIGYVYPHLNHNDMPVPGYFTAFLLYSRSHYALSAEGHHE